MLSSVAVSKSNFNNTLQKIRTQVAGIRARWRPSNHRRGQSVHARMLTKWCWCCCWCCGCWCFAASSRSFIILNHSTSLLYGWVTFGQKDDLLKMRHVKLITCGMTNFQITSHETVIGWMTFCKMTIGCTAFLKDVALIKTNIGPPAK